MLELETEGLNPEKEVGIPAFKYTSKENLILMTLGAMTYLKPHTWEGRANT